MISFLMTDKGQMARRGTLRERWNILPAPMTRDNLPNRYPLR